ncbi:MAG: hypothetical protein KAX19_02280 [Candidatus Brocadiae bacterium]|nr:hypothetical protein [Candidatus Brocadiia bacterium]
MREANAPSAGGLERVRDAYRETAEQAHREHEALASLHGLLSQFAEASLALHGRNLATIEAMRKDLDRMRRQLKRLTVART